MGRLLKHYCFVALRLYLIIRESFGLVDKGKFAVTDSDYDDAYSWGTLDSKHYYLEKHPINYDDDQTRAASMCLRHCIFNQKCKSFIINLVKRFCYLNSFNRCEQQTSPLHYYKDYITYDIRSGLDQNNGLTCYKGCLYGNNCAACGHHHCSGAECETCIKSCWDLNPLINGGTYFWLGPSSKSSWTICLNKWHLVHIYNWAHATTWSWLYTSPVFMKLIAYSTDGSQYVSVFDGFTSHGGKIDVGQYVGGGAGNDWGAPFQGRTYKYVSATNCYGFFYESSSCAAQGVPSYQSQVYNNVTTIARGYNWTVCGLPLGTGSAISSIRLFIAPQSLVSNEVATYQPVQC